MVPTSFLMRHLSLVVWHFGHDEGAATTYGLPISMARHTAMLAFTDAGQLYRDLGSLDLAPSSSSDLLTWSARFEADCVRRTPLARTAWTQEKPAALSQNAHDVTLRVHRTGATTLHRPTPDSTTTTEDCPAINVSIGPSVSQSSNCLISPVVFGTAGAGGV